jgi:tripartite-type tricarboxylate transporter receptor subunit TctC
MASSGNGTIVHMAGELFKVMSGGNMVNVLYRGEAPALSDLIAGQVQVLFGSCLDRSSTLGSGPIKKIPSFRDL